MVVDGKRTSAHIRYMSNANKSMNRVELADGRVVRNVVKYHNAALAFASAERNNGTRKENARGPGGAQVVVLGDIDDVWGAYWVADCNRDASALVNAGYEVAK